MADTDEIDDMIEERENEIDDLEEARGNAEDADETVEEVNR
jgi:hypothetical protein